MLNPFIHLISNAISLINLALILMIVLDVLISLRVVSTQNTFVFTARDTLNKLFEPLFRPIRSRLRRWLPQLSIDLSPIVFILLLHFIDDALYSWFYAI